MEGKGEKQFFDLPAITKSINELSLYRFKEILKYKASWYGRDIIEIDRWFPSSKLCSVCGYKKVDLTLNDREWICPKCNEKHDRDVNAAINIKKIGLRNQPSVTQSEWLHCACGVETTTSLV